MLDSLDTAGSGQFSKFGDRMEELGDLMTRRQMTMEEIDFESMISALQAERSGISLDESAYTKITAERSGYYISSTDGLEGRFPREDRLCHTGYASKGAGSKGTAGQRRCGQDGG